MEKLPLIEHGKHLFKQLYVQYSRNGNESATWQLVYQKKDKQKMKTSDEIIKELNRIEEIASWLVRNDLFASTASFHLMPNPTPVSIQELLEFVKDLHGFFPWKEIENLPPSALLKKPYVYKLYLAINFSLSILLPQILTKSIKLSSLNEI